MTVQQRTASAAAVPLLEQYLTEQARRLHERCGEVAGAAITLAVDGRPMTVGSSTELAAEVDAVQYAIGVGPCLAALTLGTLLHVPDLSGAPEWAPYGAEAAARGVRSCISAPVVESSDAAAPIAVVKLYSGVVDGLSEEQLRIAVASTGEIAGGIALAQLLVRQAAELDDRTAAMDSRRTIDTAIGITMERFGVDQDAAFDRLRRQSTDSNVKLRDVAAGLVTERGAPLDPAPFRRAGTPASPATS